MKINELEEKYGKKLISKILNGYYLNGCTIVIFKDGTEDIPEMDIINAIYVINGNSIGSFEWD
mgnify:CR=1 FL=1